MDYKEEYQKALERAKKGLPIDEVFPELKESEDERILRTIIRGFETWKGNGNLTFNNTNVDDILAYLKKQKEQQAAGWLDGDMKEARENLIVCCRDWELGVDTTLLPIVATRAKYFLEHLQKPAKWSEEDKEMLDAMIAIVSNSLYEPLCPREGMIAWLKALPERFNI